MHGKKKKKKTNIKEWSRGKNSKRMQRGQDGIRFGSHSSVSGTPSRPERGTKLASYIYIYPMPLRRWHAVIIRNIFTVLGSRSHYSDAERATEV